MKNENLTIAEAIAKKKDFCLEMRGGEPKLRKSHKYWYQVMGQFIW